MFQIFSCTLWYADEYWYYATAILVISIGSIALTTYSTRKVRFPAYMHICWDFFLGFAVHHIVLQFSSVNNHYRFCNEPPNLLLYETI